MAKKGWLFNIAKKIADFFGWTDGAESAAGDKYGTDNALQARAYLDEYTNTDTSDERKEEIEEMLPEEAQEAITGFNEVTEGIADTVDSYTGKRADDIAEANLNFQKENFEYQKALQQKIFDREDTANQRTVNDMRLAGLNPLNMQGTNGAGDAISTTAPQRSFEDINSRMAALDMLFNASLQSKSVNSNTSLQQANANLLNAQAENQRIKNIYESDILNNTLTNWKYQNSHNWFIKENDLMNYQFNMMNGWTENTPDWLKQSSARFGWLPFKSDVPDNLWELQKNPDNFWFWNGSNHAGINNNMSKYLLEDELLMGSLGIFGNILKLLGK